MALQPPTSCNVLLLVLLALLSRSASGALNFEETKKAIAHKRSTNSTTNSTHSSHGHGLPLHGHGLPLHGGQQHPAGGPNVAAGLKSRALGRHPISNVGNDSASDETHHAQHSWCAHRVLAAPSIVSHSWITDEDIRQLAQTSPGNRARIRAAMSRFMQGQNVTVTFVGGSISAGLGAVDAPRFTTWAEQILVGALGPRLVVHNGAVAGTLSSYMATCHNTYVPKETDIIFVEYTLNDPCDDRATMADNPARWPFERLLRALLNYPRRPAVVLLHSYKWYHGGPDDSSFWKGGERDFHEFGMYYGLAEVSVKAAAWSLMKAGVHGFIADRTRADPNGRLQPPAVDAELKGKVFYWDRVHPDGFTGHKFMGEIVAQALLDAYADAKARPVTAKELVLVQQPIPQPLFAGNWESSSNKCLIGPSFVESVKSQVGWQYVDEGKPGHPKFGFISELPGSVLRMQVNTTSSIGKKGQVNVEISYLRSYVNMGQASVDCLSGCLCQQSIIEGHQEEKTSLIHLHEFMVSQHDQCEITVTILQGTSSGKHKVKIAGIMVSEAGDGPINNRFIINDFVNSGAISRRANTRRRAH